MLSSRCFGWGEGRKERGKTDGDRFLMFVRLCVTIRLLGREIARLGSREIFCMRCV